MMWIDLHGHHVEKMRDLLNHFVGATLVDITENDGDEDCFMELLFSNGDYIKLPVDPKVGFVFSEVSKWPT